MARCFSLTAALLLVGVLPRTAMADVAPTASTRVPHAAERSLLPSNDRPRVWNGTVALSAVYDEGFRLRSPEARTELRFVWSAQLDGRAPLGSSVVPASFDIRRARLDLVATIASRLFVRIGLAAEDTPYLRNAFADYAIADALHVRVGQMKVPFSTEWATFDNQVNFLERAHAQPIHPFLDRGVLVWGAVPGAPLVYNLGLFAGAGVDADAPRGDVDSGKLLAFRVFAQPFKNVAALRGLYLVSQGTWETASAATSRFERRGMVTPTYDSNVWRWRAEQTLGSNGRESDLVDAAIASKARVGAEVHYLRGPFTLSAEASTLQWTGIDVSHELVRGGRTLADEPVLTTSGRMHAASVWSSLFLTGESKILDNFGWRQPNPSRPLLGGDGMGALELLVRGSVMEVSAALFEPRRVAGFTTARAGGARAPGEGASADVSVLEGARRLHEVTLGLSWTLAYATRIQLNLVHTWVPDFEAGSNGIVSGASSDMSDLARKNRLVPSETLLGARVIFRI